MAEQTNHALPIKAATQLLYDVSMLGGNTTPFEALTNRNCLDCETSAGGTLACSGAKVAAQLTTNEVREVYITGCSAAHLPEDAEALECAVVARLLLVDACALPVL